MNAATCNGFGSPETPVTEVERAEPDTELHCSPVLRSDAVTTGETDGAGAERREAPPASALPCLFSNKCTEEEKAEKKATAPVNILKGGHKRSAQVLYLEIMALVKTYGLNRIGFLTMTFKDHVTNLREAQRRFRSIRAHVIVKRYARAIAVWERQKSGRIHFHLMVVVKEDIRTGAIFEAFKL
jgi:hypothetical protein